MLISRKYSIYTRLSYSSCRILDTMRSKFAFPLFGETICFYSLGAFPRRFHSSVSVRLVATSRNSTLSLFLSLLLPLVLPPDRKFYFSLSLLSRSLFKIRAFDSAQVSASYTFPLLPHQLLFIHGFIFSLRLAGAHIHIQFLFPG